MEELLNKELTYGQLTRGVLKEEPKRGDSKEKQLKKIKSLCRLKTKEIITGKKKNYAYIIEEIYQEPKEIIDNRKNNKGRPTKYLDKQFKVPKEDWYKNGIYKIQFENKVYIGSTKDFRYRYMRHLSVDKKEMPHVWELLKEEEHIFEVLEVVENIEELNIREQYYIDLYLNDNNYIVVNKQCAYKEKILKEHETKYIKVSKEDYEKAIEILRKEGIEII